MDGRRRDYIASIAAQIDALSDPHAIADGISRMFEIQMPAATPRVRLYGC